MSTPDAQDKKVPQFSSFTMRPATAPAESCCTDHACATESAPAAEALSGARYSWQVDGMDCAACARKVETAVRQVPGVSQVQVLFATEKLLVNAEGDVRALLVDVCDDGAGLAVKAVLRAVVADVADDVARDLRDVDIAARGDLAHDVNKAGGDGRLAGHAAVGVFFKDRVEHRIGDLVADLVGMPLGDGFGGE